MSRPGAAVSQELLIRLGQLAAAGDEPGVVETITATPAEDRSYLPFYEAVEDEIRQPHEGHQTTDYFIDHWLPRLGGLRAAIVLALRRWARAAQRDPRGWQLCSPTATALAQMVGLKDRGTVRGLLDPRRCPEIALFIRREPQYIIRDGNPRRTGDLYYVAMDDPLIPEHHAEAVKRAAARIIAASARRTGPMVHMRRIPDTEIAREGGNRADSHAGAKPSHGAVRDLRTREKPVGTSALHAEVEPAHGRYGAGRLPGSEGGPGGTPTSIMPQAVTPDDASRPQHDVDVEDVVVQQRAVRTRLTEHGIAAPVAERLLRECPLVIIRRQVEWFPYRTTITTNPPGALVQAIRENWPPPQAVVDAQRRVETVEADERQRRDEAERAAADEARRARLDALYESLPAHTQDALRTEAQALLETETGGVAGSSETMLRVKIRELVEQRVTTLPSVERSPLPPSGKFMHPDLVAPSRLAPAPAKVIDAIEAFYGWNIREGRRERQRVQVRWVAWLVMKEFGYSLMSIGRVFKVDHTTVMAGVRRAQEDADVVAEAQRWIQQFRTATGERKEGRDRTDAGAD